MFVQSVPTLPVCDVIFLNSQTHNKLTCNGTSSQKAVHEICARTRRYRLIMSYQYIKWQNQIRLLPL